MPHPAAAPDPGAAENGPALGPLSQLVIEANVSESYERMAARAIDRATGEQLISRGYLHKLAKTPPAKAPSEKEMLGISLAIRQPLRIVQKATAEQYLGYVAVELSGYGEDVRRIIGYLEGQAPEEVARWRAMMEASDQAQQRER